MSILINAVSKCDPPFGWCISHGLHVGVSDEVNWITSLWGIFLSLYLYRQVGVLMSIKMKSSTPDLKTDQQ